MSSVANVNEAEFWNNVVGQVWVEHQPELDHIHGNVGDLVLEAADPASGEVTLDIGCGAGATSLALASAVGPTGAVLGVDLSVPLVARAETRRQEIGAANVSFLVADAQDHPFQAEVFDLVVSRFGVMFFADPVAAFANIGGSMRPGGRLVCAAWAGPEFNPWFSLPQRLAIERLGPVTSTPPEAPGPMAFRDIARVCGILADAGFSKCEGQRVMTDLHHPGGFAAAARLSAKVGPTGRIMREKNGTPDDSAAIGAAMAAALEGYATADGVRIPAGVNLFSATWR